MTETPKKRVLVLGASGLLGCSLMPYLRSVGFETVAHGHGSTNGADLVCDATDPAQLHKLIQGQSPDFIVNLIALTNVDRCNSDINLAYRLNVMVIENIVAAIADLPEGKGRLVQISTDHVYDKAKGASAEHEAVMRNVYALSKYAGDMVAQSGESVVLRTNFFGPGSIGTRRSFSDVIHDTVIAGDNFFAFDDCYFNPLSSKHLSEEIARVMHRWNPGTYNLGAATGMSKYEFARQLVLSLGLDASLVKPRSLASVSGMAARPLNMLMNVEAYQSAFDTSLPTLQQLIEKIGENQNDQ